MAKTITVTLTTSDFYTMVSALEVVCDDYKGTKKAQEHFLPVLKRINILCEDNTKYKIVPYPKNLIAAIKNIDPKDLQDEYYGTDTILAISYVLDTLTDQEADMIRFRYKNHETLEQVGAHYGLTRERARQIINKALRKLRHPSRRKWYEKGLQGYIDDTINACVEDRVKSLLLGEYMRGYEDGIADKEEKSVFELSIEELDLTIRTYCCLKKANIETVGDILSYKRKYDIMQINGIDKKMCREIVLELNRLEISSEAWESVFDPKEEEWEWENDWGFLSDDAE